ncbi:hypothetical protein FIBSPDRAFT_958508 [Athelia psychrophila]|uniref:Uncharacterized protein n=1 Tax=Athelia psychrophila TaxID=1759441 RepID=A0A166EJS0_9AGAM|nr:hypothetical protein FIBSPDRAFT_958508 [Fibularhizoctonia sp. CBS 109695]
MPPRQDHVWDNMSPEDQQRILERGQRSAFLLSMLPYHLDATSSISASGNSNTGSSARSNHSNPSSRNGSNRSSTSLACLPRHTISISNHSTAISSSSRWDFNLSPSVTSPTNQHHLCHHHRQSLLLDVNMLLHVTNTWLSKTRKRMTL